MKKSKKSYERRGLLNILIFCYFFVNKFIIGEWRGRIIGVGSHLYSSKLYILNALELLFWCCIVLWLKQLQFIICDICVRYCLLHIKSTLFESFLTTNPSESTTPQANYRGTRIVREATVYKLVYYVSSWMLWQWSAPPPIRTRPIN